MITSNDFYNNYIVKVDIEIIPLRNHVNELKKIRDKVTAILRKNTDNVEKLTNISIDVLRKRTKLNNLYVPIPKEKSITLFIVPQGGLEKQKLKFQIEKLIILNKQISKVSRVLKHKLKTRITWVIYKDIITQFNQAMVDEMLKGYAFNPCNGVGKMLIVNKKVKKPLIDWGTSNKNKAELISKGITPYEVLEKDSEFNILKDNGGEKWQVFHTAPYTCWWYWFKTDCKAENKKYYSLSFTTGDNGNIKKLAAYRKNNKFADLNYTVL